MIRQIVCACGKTFETASNNPAIIRCAECNREIKTERNRHWREQEAAAEGRTLGKRGRHPRLPKILKCVDCGCEVEAGKHYSHWIPRCEEHGKNHHRQMVAESYRRCVERRSAGIPLRVIDGQYCTYACAHWAECCQAVFIGAPLHCAPDSGVDTAYRDTEAAAEVSKWRGQIEAMYGKYPHTEDVRDVSSEVVKELRAEVDRLTAELAAANHQAEMAKYKIAELASLQDAVAAELAALKAKHEWISVDVVYIHEPLPEPPEQP